MEFNELIAKFMGLYEGKKHVFGSFWCETTYPYNIIRAQYQDKWDWLIPVVSKITGILEEYTVAGFDDGYPASNLFYAVLHGNIERTYLEVIEFINWYNT